MTSNVLVLANAKPGAALPAVKASLGRLVANYPQFVLYDSVGFKATQSKIFSQSFVVFDVLIAFFALPTLLALLNTLAISVLARTREIGMLRAVGTTRGQVRGMVVAEALLLAAVGVVFGIAGGVALGYALVYALNSTMYVMPYYFPWGGHRGRGDLGLQLRAARVDHPGADGRQARHRGGAALRVALAVCPACVVMRARSG